MQKNFLLLISLSALLISACSSLPAQHQPILTSSINQFHGRLIIIESTHRWQTLIRWKANQYSGYTRLTHAATGRIIEVKWKDKTIQARDNLADISRWKPISIQELQQYGIILPPQMIAAILQKNIPSFFKQKNPYTWQGEYHGNLIRLHRQQNRLSITDLKHGKIAHLIIQP
ncbi:MAG: hypothetical protein R8K49_07650 [Mariprofundaceae bacterium]